MAKPTLGYPSRTAAVEALARQGLSDFEIASRIGIALKTVSALRCSAGRSKQPANAIVHLKLSPATTKALQAEASARSLSTTELVRSLLDTLTEDDIIGAVLDDAFGDALEADHG